MDSAVFYDFLEAYSVETDEAELVLGEPMRLHTSFHIGGSADVFVTPYSEEALIIGLELCQEFKMPYFILGNGSNLLVGDRGIRGCVFDMTGLNAVKVEDEVLTAGAGASLIQVARTAASARLSGLEFAAGIPGSLGGAIFMNAGAYGGEMKDIVESVRVLGKDGEIREIPGSDMDFGYRHSRLETEGGIVLSARLKLQRGDEEAITECMKELRIKRQEKQPIGNYSAGSTFKRPEGYFAGKLIEDAGLKGFSVGAAQVSEKHAGFVINRGGASAAEVCALMKQVEEKVRADFGVTLEPEVKMIGEF